MTGRYISLLIALVAGVLIGAFATGGDGDNRDAAGVAPTSRSDAASSDSARFANYDEIISSLYETLDLEVQERMRLEEQLADLQGQVSRLTTTLEGRPAPTAAAEKATARIRNRGVVTEETLVEAGFNEVEAAMIKGRLDQIELDQLFLRDNAVREGWMGSARYRDAVRDLNARRNGLRDELGPEGWDKYLYAIGRPNRVVVNSVLNDSPAFNAGLKPGDLILSYEGQRVFSQSDVRNQTVGGPVGNMITMEIERDGRRQQVYLPRGPLGVRLGSSVEKP